MMYFSVIQYAVAAHVFIVCVQLLLDVIQRKSLRKLLLVFGVNAAADIMFKDRGIIMLLRRTLFQTIGYKALQFNNASGGALFVYGINVCIVTAKRFHNGKLFPKPYI